MPYTSQDKRQKFEALIADAVSVMRDGNEPTYTKGEYLGYLINRMCLRYSVSSSYQMNYFNSGNFKVDKKDKLSATADKLAAMIDRTDPIGSAEELGYVIMTLSLRFLSGHAYGTSVYVRGILEWINEAMRAGGNSRPNKDAVTTFRRHLVIGGVISDVVDEMFRSYTSRHLDHKIKKNGPIGGF